ncbi:MAG: methyltransferase domain-containing protein [Defluviitaleaceae bacterium]|nr:methyltransferase domain-containing protein [Defluviitaleaceae bacterium]
MINKIEAGKRISSMRGKLGYSQAVFAEKLNVTPQAVSKWETGQTLPDVDILLALSWMCRVTINEILDSNEVFVDQLNSIERELIRMNKFLVCPECNDGMSLKVQGVSGRQYYECGNNHRFNIDDGVIYFNSREVDGELWSLYLRNYEHYLKEATHPGLPRYMEGDISFKEIMWREIEKLRPATILDLACGTGNGIKYILERINWPCTVVLTDLSHRILAWNRRFFTEEMRNPYVDYVFLACDCANIPICDNSIDMVFSNTGFESMQDKMMAGFKEAQRILKPGGHAVYNMSLVDDHSSKNTKKWIDLLYKSLSEDSPFDKNLLRDALQWQAKCKITGFSENQSIKIYSEMPAPDTQEFPFENMILRWMGCHVFVSRK